MIIIMRGSERKPITLAYLTFFFEKGKEFYKLHSQEGAKRNFDN